MYVLYCLLGKVSIVVFLATKLLIVAVARMVGFELVVIQLCDARTTVAANTLLTIR